MRVPSWARRLQQHVRSTQQQPPQQNGPHAPLSVALGEGEKGCQLWDWVEGQSKPRSVVRSKERAAPMCSPLGFLRLCRHTEGTIQHHEVGPYTHVDRFDRRDHARPERSIGAGGEICRKHIRARTYPLALRWSIEFDRSQCWDCPGQEERGVPACGCCAWAWAILEEGGEGRGGKGNVPPSLQRLCDGVVVDRCATRSGGRIGRWEGPDKGG